MLLRVKLDDSCSSSNSFKDLSHGGEVRKMLLLRLQRCACTTHAICSSSMLRSANHSSTEGDFQA